MWRIVAVAALSAILPMASSSLAQSADGTEATAVKTADQRIDEQRIEKLVEQLGSVKYADRARAQKELQALGVKALPAWKRAAEGTDLETSRRASDMVRKLEEKLTTANILSPKKVRLNVKDVTVEQAIDRLSKLSGYPIQLADTKNNGDQRKITLDTGMVTFWEALDQLCTKAGLVESDVRRTTINRGRNRFQIQPVPAPAPGQPRILPNQKRIVPNKIQKKAIQKIQVQIQGGRVQILPAQPVPAKAEPGKADPEKAAPAKPAEDVPQAQPAKRAGFVPRFKAVQVPQPEEKKAEQPADEPAQPQPAQPQPAPAQPRPNIKIIPKAQARIQFVRPNVPVQAKGQQQQITLTPGEPKNVPTHYQGAVRFRLLTEVPKQNIQPVQDGSRILYLEVSPEPKLDGFQVVGSPSITRAIDDQGQAWKVAMNPQPDPAINGINGINNNIVIVNGFRRTSSAAQNRIIPIVFDKVEKNARSLKEVTGTVTASVMLPPEPLMTIKNVLKAGGKTARGKEGGSLTLQSINKQADGTYRVELDVENAGQNPLGGGGGIVIVGNAQVRIAGAGFGRVNNSNAPQLVDAKGNAYKVQQVPRSSMQINNGTIRQSLTIVYQADNNQGEPAELRQVGSPRTSIAIPFRFENVQLP